MSVGTGPLLIPPSSKRLVVHGRGFPEGYLNYNVVLIIALQKSDSVIHIFFFHILFHHGLSQDIEYGFLCCTVGPCCLSILYMPVFICYPKLQSNPSSLLSLWQPQVCSLRPWFCFWSQISFIWLSLIDLLVLVLWLYCTWYDKSLVASVLLQITLFFSFIWLSGIPLYICAISSLSTHLSMDI